MAVLFYSFFLGLAFLTALLSKTSANQSMTPTVARQAPLRTPLAKQKHLPSSSSSSLSSATRNPLSFSNVEQDISTRDANDQFSVLHFESLWNTHDNGEQHNDDLFFSVESEIEFLVKALSEEQLPVGFTGCSNYNNTKSTDESLQQQQQQQQEFANSPFCPENTLLLQSFIDRDIVIRSSEEMSDIETVLWYRPAQNEQTQPIFVVAVSDVDHEVQITSTQVSQQDTVFYNVSVDITVTRKPGIFNVTVWEYNTQQSFNIWVYVAGFAMVETDLGLLHLDGEVSVPYQQTLNTSIMTLKTSFFGETSTMRRLGVDPLNYSFASTVNLTPHLYQNVYNYSESICDPYSDAILNSNNKTVYFETESCTLGFTFDYSHFGIGFNLYRAGWVLVDLLFSGFFIENGVVLDRYQASITVQVTGLPPPVYTNIEPLNETQNQDPTFMQSNQSDYSLNFWGNQLLKVSGYNLYGVESYDMRILTPSYRSFMFVDRRAVDDFHQEITFRTVPVESTGQILIEGKDWGISATTTIDKDQTIIVFFKFLFQPFRLIFDPTPVANNSQTKVLVHLDIVNNSIQGILDQAHVVTGLYADSGNVSRKWSFPSNIYQLVSPAENELRSIKFNLLGGLGPVKQHDISDIYRSSYVILVPLGTQLKTKSAIEELMESERFYEQTGLDTISYTIIIEDSDLSAEKETGEAVSTGMIAAGTVIVAIAIAASASQTTSSAVAILAGSTASAINMGLFFSGTGPQAQTIFISTSVNLTAGTQGTQAAQMVQSANTMSTIFDPSTTVVGSSSILPGTVGSSSTLPGSTGILGANNGDAMSTINYADVGATNGAANTFVKQKVFAENSTAADKAFQIQNDGSTMLRELQFGGAIAWTGIVPPPMLNAGVGISVFNFLIRSPFSSGYNTSEEASEPTNFKSSRSLFAVDNIYDIYDADINDIFIGQMFYISIVVVSLIILHASSYLLLRSKRRAYQIAMNVLPRVEVLFMNVIHMGLFIGGFRILQSSNSTGLKLMAVIVIIVLGIGYPVFVIILLRKKVAPYMNKEWLGNYFRRHLLYGGWSFFGYSDEQEREKIRNSWKQNEKLSGFDHYFFVEKKHGRYQGIWFATSSTRMRYGSLFEPYRGQYYGFVVFEMSIIALEGAIVGVFVNVPEIQAGLITALCILELLVLLWLWPYNDILEQIAQLIIASINVSICALLLVILRYPANDPAAINVSTAMLWLNIAAVTIAGLYSFLITIEIIRANKKFILDKLKQCLGVESEGFSISESSTGSESSMSWYYSSSDNESTSTSTDSSKDSTSVDSTNISSFETLSLSSTYIPDVLLKKNSQYSSKIYDEENDDDEDDEDAAEEFLHEFYYGSQTRALAISKSTNDMLRIKSKV